MQFKIHKNRIRANNLARKDGHLLQKDSNLVYKDRTLAHKDSNLVQVDSDLVNPESYYARTAGQESPECQGWGKRRYSLQQHQRTFSEREEDMLKENESRIQLLGKPF